MCVTNVPESQISVHFTLRLADFKMTNYPLYAKYIPPSLKFACFPLQTAVFEIQGFQNHTMCQNGLTMTLNT